MCTYNISFIHSSLDEYLDCFYFLVFVSNAAMNIGVQVSKSLHLILLGIFLGVKLLITLCLIFFFHLFLLVGG